MWPLTFISEADLITHVKKTIEQYDQKLDPYDLVKFNSNLVDPVKMTFDRLVYRLSEEEIIKSEIFRQRDKSNNNDIGYFHQQIFSYFPNCEVPPNGTKGGWDVIWTIPEGLKLPDGTVVHKVYAEIKNKHNTMNNASANDTYKKMQNQIIKDDDCACFLVEVIAKKSQNEKWKRKGEEHKCIRRVSIDQFFSMVTGQFDAFLQLCLVLPVIIKKVLESKEGVLIKPDTVFEEIENSGMGFTFALLNLAFTSYNGFNQISRSEQEV